MAGEIPAVCSACGEELGAPDDEVAHPDDDDPPEDAHFKVQIRESDGGERLQCTKNGQLASPIGPEDPEHPANEGSPEGGGEGRSGAQNGGRRQQEVYDLPEEKSQMQILAEVVSNPHYGLEDPQIQEVRSWAEDFDGQLPPDTLEDMLKNFSGVKKQTAQLVRQRYELKLNKWIREQSNQDDGPPIGVNQPTPMPTPQSGGRQPQQRSRQPQPGHATPTPSTNEKTDNQTEEEEELSVGDGPGRDIRGQGSGRVRSLRRRRRVQRRNDAADIATEEMAKQVAPELARELTSNLGTYFGLPAKIIEAKVEKDPDWALEKLESMGLDFDDIMEPSDAKKKEMREERERNKQSAVDHEVDNALDNIMNGGNQEPEMDNQPQMEAEPEQGETPKSPPYEERDASPMSASPHDPEPEDGDGDEMFDEIFEEDN